ncbi:hypothetical protein MY11210_009416 [Beauveria gryllotalpidicola]
MISKILTVTTFALAALFSVAANPSPLPMGVEITERDGMTFVREVAHEELGVEKRCRECVHLGGRCTIGDGSCYAREHGSCTWCGNNCKSICVPDGATCQQWCL